MLHKLIVSLVPRLLPCPCTQAPPPFSYPGSSPVLVPRLLPHSRTQAPPPFSYPGSSPVLVPRLLPRPRTQAPPPSLYPGSSPVLQGKSLGARLLFVTHKPQFYLQMMYIICVSVRLLCVYRFECAIISRCKFLLLYTQGTYAGQFVMEVCSIHR